MTFILILAVILAMFGIFVFAITMLERARARRDQEFKQRVDRYRRGHH